MVHVDFPGRSMLAASGAEWPYARAPEESPEMRTAQNFRIPLLPKLLVSIRGLVRFIFVRVLDTEVRHEGSRPRLG